MTKAKSTLVDTVGSNGHTIEIRRYDLGSKIEFRFPWRDKDGKRHFRCCRTLTEAKKAAQEFSSNAPALASVNPAAATGHPGLTLEILAEAARVLGIGTGKVAHFDQSFAQTCDEFLAAKKAKLERGEIRSETYKELESRLRPLKKALGKVKMGELTTAKMDEALSTLTVSSRSVSNCRDKLRAVLRWATNRNKAPESLLRAFAAMEVVGSKAKSAEKIDPFTRVEIAALLEEARSNAFDPTRANYRMVAVLALQAFSGLRAAEACRLTWEEIDLLHGMIRLPAEKAKTKRARTIEIPPNLRQWLELFPVEERRGALYAGFAYSKAQGRLAQRVARKLKGFQWRDNALRQAFVANYIAFSDSISETAYRAGTSESKIRTNYWKLVSKADAIAYFDLVPNIIVSTSPTKAAAEKSPNAPKAE